MKVISGFLALVVLALLLSPLTGYAGSGNGHYAALAADMEVRRNVMIVAFVAHGCKYCDQQMPALEYVYEKYNGRVGIEIVERTQEPELFSRFQISVTPTLVLFNGKGEMLGRYDGLTDVQELDSAILQTVGY